MKGTTAWILSMAYTKKHSGGSGTNDYNQLINRPKINGVTLSGDKVADDLDLVDQNESLTPAQLDDLLAMI